jgi:hypothetical protein
VLGFKQVDLTKGAIVRPHGNIRDVTLVDYQKLLLRDSKL